LGTQQKLHARFQDCVGKVVLLNYCYLLLPETFDHDGAKQCKVQALVKEPNYDSLDIFLPQLSPVVTLHVLEPVSDMSHIKFHFDTFQTIVAGTLQQTLELSHHQAIQRITLITRSVLQLSQSTLTRLSSLISTGKS